MLVGFPERLKVLELDYIKIDGLPAVRRLYEYPLVDPATYELIGTQYNYQLLVLEGKDLFYFRMFTTSAEEFEMYKEIADKIVFTIVFKR